MGDTHKEKKQKISATGKAVAASQSDNKRPQQNQDSKQRKSTATNGVKKGSGSGVESAKDVQKQTQEAQNAPSKAAIIRKRGQIAPKIVKQSDSGTKIRDKFHWTKVLNDDTISRLELKVGQPTNKYMENNLKLTIGAGEHAPLLTFVTEPIMILGANLTGTGKVGDADKKDEEKPSISESKYSATGILNQFDEEIIKKDPDIVSRQADMVDALYSAVTHVLTMMYETKGVCESAKAQIRKRVAESMSRQTKKRVGEILAENSEALTSEVREQFMSGANVFFNMKEQTEADVNKYGAYDRSHLEGLEDEQDARLNENFIFHATQRAFWPKSNVPAGGAKPGTTPPTQLVKQETGAANTTTTSASANNVNSSNKTHADGTVSSEIDKRAMTEISDCEKKISVASGNDKLNIAAAFLKTITTMAEAGFEFSPPKIYSKEGENMFNWSTPNDRIAGRFDFAQFMVSVRPSSRISPSIIWSVGFDLKCIWLVQKSLSGFMDYSNDIEYAPTSEMIGKMMAGDIKGLKEYNEKESHEHGKEYTHIIPPPLKLISHTTSLPPSPFFY